MRDIGHEVLSGGLKSLELRDVARHQQALLVAIGNQLQLKASIGRGQAMEHHGLGPLLPFNVVGESGVPHQVEDVSPLVGGQLQPQMLLGPMAGEDDLVVVVQRHHPIGHGLGHTPKARQELVGLCLLPLIGAGQAVDGGIEPIPSPQAGGGLADAKVREPAVHLLQVIDLKADPDHQAGNGRVASCTRATDQFGGQAQENDQPAGEGDLDPEAQHRPRLWGAVRQGRLLSERLGGEAVATAPNRLDVPVVGRRGERLAQPADMDIHSALFHIDMVAPDLVEQLAAAVDPLGVGHEEVQEPELSGPEFERLAIAQHPMGLGIELETTDIHCMVGQGGNASAKHGLDAGLQFFG